MSTHAEIIDRFIIEQYVNRQIASMKAYNSMWYFDALYPDEVENIEPIRLSPTQSDDN